MPCVVRWADPSVVEATIVRTYCPSLADKIEAAGPYRRDEVDPTKQELRQFREAMEARWPDMRAATRGVGKSSFLFERKRLERLVEEIRANSSVVRLNWRRFLDPRG